MVPPAPTCLGAVPPQACTGRHSSSSKVALRCSVAIKVLRSLDSRPVVLIAAYDCSTMVADSDWAHTVAPKDTKTETSTL